MTVQQGVATRLAPTRVSDERRLSTWIFLCKCSCGFYLELPSDIYSVTGAPIASRGRGGTPQSCPNTGKRFPHAGGRCWRSTKELGRSRRENGEKCLLKLLNMFGLHNKSGIGNTNLYYDVCFTKL